MYTPPTSVWPLSSHSHFKRRHFLTYLQTETRNTPPTQNQTTHTYTCFCRYGLPQRVAYHRKVSLPTTYIGSYGSESADTGRESGATPICSWLGDITSPTVLTLTHHNTRYKTQDNEDTQPQIHEHHNIHRHQKHYYIAWYILLCYRAKRFPHTHTHSPFFPDTHSRCTHLCLCSHNDHIIEYYKNTLTHLQTNTVTQENTNTQQMYSPLFSFSQWSHHWRLQKKNINKLTDKHRNTRKYEHTADVLTSFFDLTMITSCFNDRSIWNPPSHRRNPLPPPSSQAFVQNFLKTCSRSQLDILYTTPVKVFLLQN